MKRGLIIGLGISGLAAAELLLRDGYEVVAVDKNCDELSCAAHRLIQLGVSIRKETDLLDVGLFDIVVVSPGVHPDHLLYQEADKRGVELIGEAELALRKVRQPCIGITGTNGKTTVTALVEHILRHAGKKARALGNVGKSLAEYFLAPDPEEILVIELSSYQLETLQAPVLDTGVILNITPDHLDRYATMHEYARAKCRLQLCVKLSGSFFVDAKTAQNYKDLLQQERVLTFGNHEEAHFFTDTKRAIKNEEFPQELYALPPCYHDKGMHESENILAAWLLTRPFDVSVEQFTQAVETFKKPLHRIEHVANINGVDYYDDSKGTNIDAVIKAVNAMPGKIVLLAGGIDKGSSYSSWEIPFLGKVKKIIAFGQAREKIAKEAGTFCQVDVVEDLEHAVQTASRSAQHGECVLLSPGCSSYDMFRDYAHRGEEFQRCVRQLNSFGD